MDVSVVVTCYNEEKNIQACLDSLIQQDYTSGKFEIIVSDGNSHDGTQIIIKEYVGRLNNIKFVVEPKKGTAAGRNAGVKGATYNYIAFIDADCEAPPKWLSMLVESYQQIKLKSPNVIAVGGRNIAPIDAGRFLQGLEIVLDSYIGSFSSIQGRHFKTPVLVSSLSTVNALYEKEKLLEIGCFDESLGSEAEDADINYRLCFTGNKFLFVPNSFVWHKMRTSPSLWIKNMFRYGKGRARLLKRYPNMWNISFLLPILFIVSMGTGFLGIFQEIFFFPLLYFPFIALFSLYQCKSKRALNLFLIVVYIYIIQHFAYACGEMYGLINRRIK